VVTKPVESIMELPLVMVVVGFSNEVFADWPPCKLVKNSVNLLINHQLKIIIIIIIIITGIWTMYVRKMAIALWM
jgi:hypothetical protein